MSGKDDATIGFYAREAQAYATRGMEALTPWLEPFLTLVPSGGKILELGCGAGQDSEALLAAGFDVTPTDGTPEIAKQAEQRLGRLVPVLLFEDITFDAEFDGVWANACPLHVPRAGLGPILQRIRGALKHGGVLYASFKAGSAEGHDGFGRFFNYPDETFLRQAIGDGWRSVDISAGEGSGYDKPPTAWLYVLAIKA